MHWRPSPFLDEKLYKSLESDTEVIIFSKKCIQGEKHSKIYGKSCQHLECFIDKNQFLNCVFNKADNCGNSTRFRRENSTVKLQKQFYIIQCSFPPHTKYLINKQNMYNCPYFIKREWQFQDNLLNYLSKLLQLVKEQVTDRTLLFTIQLDFKFKYSDSKSEAPVQ